MLMTSKSAIKKFAFTLIELLIVIAIIGILTSLLLPVLVHTKKKAKNVLCTNNLKQTGIALISYADDFNSYWPDAGAPNLNPVSDSYIDGQRRNSSALAASWNDPVSGTPGPFDLRPILREYFSEKLSQTLACPLGSNWYSDPENSPYESWDIDGASANWAHGRYASYTFFPSSHISSFGLWKEPDNLMRRTGDSFTLRAGTGIDQTFRMLAADVLYSDSIGVSYMMHQPKLGAGVDEHAVSPRPTGTKAAYIGAMTSANFLSDDGSVKHYIFEAPSAYTDSEWFTGWKIDKGYLLPSDSAD